MTDLLVEGVRAGVDVVDLLFLDWEVRELVVVVVSGLARLLSLLAGSAVSRYLRRTALARLGRAGRTRHRRLLGRIDDARRTGSLELKFALNLAERDGGTARSILEVDQ